MSGRLLAIGVAVFVLAVVAITIAIIAALYWYSG